MSANATIEDRLAAVEAAVAELQKDRLIQTPAADWLEQVIGSFQDEPAFEEVLAAKVVFEGLGTHRLRVGTMDLRIASIVQSRGLVLLTRNSADFARVPGLIIEDWTR